jgi:hypothetical protein
MRSLETLAKILLSESVQQGDCIVNLSRTPSQPYPTIQGPTGIIGGHRVIWELHNGSIPPGRQFHLHHTCEVQRCLNIDHLELLTNAEHQSRHKRFEECPKHGTPFAYRTDRGEGICRACKREYVAARRAKDPEKFKMYAQEWAASRTEEQKAARRERNKLWMRAYAARKKAEKEAQASA